MKLRTKISALLTTLFVPTLSYAYEFEVDGIYYNKNADGETVSVTYNKGEGTDYSGSVTIPSKVTYDGTTYTVTEITEFAFRNNTQLTAVTIANTVTRIGRLAFYNCSSLATIKIPDSVTYIGTVAFSGTPWWDNQPDGLLYIGKVAYKYKGTMPENTSITIKDGTVCIGASAFAYRSGMTSITLPNSLQEIDGSAFDNCTGLTSVTIPNSVTKLGDSAFYMCSGLTSVTIPDSVTEIGNAVFNDCTALSSITLPESVTSMGNYVFMRCTGLTSITIPDLVTSIGKSAFYVCSGLTSITIPDPVTSIGEEAFYGCSALTSITIPNSVTKIGKSTFDSCSGLTSVTIPNSVTEIGSLAFYNCNSIRVFTSLNETPPTVSPENTFKGIPTDCTLYVPQASIDAYKQAFGWARFTNIEAIKDGGVDSLGANAPKVSVAGGAIRIDGVGDATVNVYSLCGALLYRGTDTTIVMPRGIYIVKVADTTAKVIL